MTVAGLDLLLIAVLLLLVCTALARPLHDVLDELCGTDGRARFWVVMSETALAACVLLAVAVSFSPAMADIGVGRVAAPLRGASGGALLALGAIVLVVVAFERRAQSDA
jgi:hypothetical protein